MFLTFGLTWVSWVEVLLVGSFIDPQPPPYLDFLVILRHLTFLFMPGIWTYLFLTELKWESLAYRLHKNWAWVVLFICRLERLC